MFSFRHALVGCALLSLVGCGSDDAVPGDAEVPRKPRSILLITVDTTRADHLSPYGAETAETPTMQALAGEGVF